MPFNKEDNMVLKAEARYNPLFNSGIVFYNLDTNNRLGFQMKRKNVIVPLSEINVQSYISLIAQDGSSIVDNLKFENELQGVLSYRIPAEFLKHTGNVHAEVHITTNGKDDTVVMGEFDFEIKDASINKLPADIKIGYIRMFDDLKKTIEQKVADIQAAIANGQDYVTAIQNASAAAKQAIDSSVAGAKADIDTKVTTVTTNLNKTAADATKAITDTAKSATDSVDADLQEFKDTVANNGFLKPSDTDTWQKFAFTDKNGIPFATGNLTDWNDILTLGLGRLLVDTNTVSTNAPVNVGGRYYDVEVFFRTKTTGHIVATEMVQGKVFYRARAGRPGAEVWSDWVELESTTGSAQKVADLKALLIDIMPTAENGGSKRRFNGTDDMVAEIQSLKKGIYTYYTPAGTPNAPTTGANRGLIIKTDDTVGYVWATDTQANFYSGYQNGASSWSGWKTYGSSLLWSGTAVANVGRQFALSQPRDNFRKLELLVSINEVGEFWVEMNARGTATSSLEVTNVFDDGTGTLHYELALYKIADKTRLEVRSEARYNTSTGNGLVNNKDWTILEIWGVN